MPPYPPGLEIGGLVRAGGPMGPEASGVFPSWVGGGFHHVASPFFFFFSAPFFFKSILFRGGARGGAGGGDSTCLPPRQGGRRGAFGSPPGHSLPETSPFGSLGSAHATTPLPPLHPSLSPGVSLGRSRAFPPEPRDCLVRRLRATLLPWESRNTISCGALVPAAVPRVPSFPVPRSQGPWVLDCRRRGSLLGLGPGRPRPLT